MFRRIKRKIKNIVENIAGIIILRKEYFDQLNKNYEQLLIDKNQLKKKYKRTLNKTFGYNLTRDISNRFPNYHLKTIFDVGANVGQSALNYISKYPSAVIYCFEPIKESYDQLLKNVDNKNQVLCFNLAFGDFSRKGNMISNGTSTMNRLVHEEIESFGDTQKIESVNISTVDEFCNANEINNISYLKIDTEGGDLNVLKGSKNILSTKIVDFVEVEAGMNPNNKHHVPFEALKKFLEGHNYFIFGIYEQVREWPERKPNLRRANVVFISEKMIQNAR